MKKFIKALVFMVFILLLSINNPKVSALDCSKTLREGSKGSAVKELQTLLNQKANCTLDVDGSFGPLTKSCVKKYQTENNLEVDGIVGPMTCSSLNLTTNTTKVSETSASNSTKYQVTASSLNVRSGAGTTYSIIGQLSNGTIVTVTNKSNSAWYKVSANGIIGYVSTKYLKEIKTISSGLGTNKYIVLESSVNVRKKATTSSNIITTVSRGTKVTVTGTSGSWYKVSVNNKTGYIRSDLLTRDLVIVDISDQMLYYFKDGKNVLTASVVTGLKGTHDTPTGNYTLYTSSKEKKRYLDGYKNGQRIYHSYVDYWMPFNGGVGFHDAEYHIDYDSNGNKIKEHGWRSTFGGNIYITNGSHGCVNMKNSDAKFLYENTTVNTAVIVRN